MQTKIIAFNIGNLKCNIINENIHALLSRNEDDSLNKTKQTKIKKVISQKKQ